MNANDITRKRAMLISARMRFSPATQPVRDTAIDTLVERNMAMADGHSGMTEHELDDQGIAASAGGPPAITRRDLSDSLARLTRSDRIVVSDETGKKVYRLSAQALCEHETNRDLAEARFRHVVERLFPNVREGCHMYESPLLDCLCLVFSQLGEMYVRLITGSAPIEDVLSAPIVLHAVQHATADYPAIDNTLFQSAVLRFFQETDPDYAAIKWNLAQNYYVAKALGLDTSRRLLSAELFGHAEFYLDTNVLVDALVPRTLFHGSLQRLGEACKQLGSSFKVCKISLDELQRVVETNRNLILRVADQIPPETAPKIRDAFYRLYREHLDTRGSVDPDQTFEVFDHPLENLSGLYDVQLVHARWFDDAPKQPDFALLVNRVKRAYGTKFGRTKTDNAALHDALLLKWVFAERERTGADIWLVTLDNSLPSILLHEGEGNQRPVALSLAALLQWISPIAMHNDEDQVAAIFSEAISDQLLPQGALFDLRDFLVFAEMEWSAKELPAEDVEECIRYLKAKAPELDPSDPADRERIAREMSRFFADPGRKFQQTLERLEAELAQVSEQLTAKVQERDRRIAELQKERLEAKDLREQEALLRSARWRVAIAGLVLLIIVGMAVDIAWVYGKGDNFFQRVADLWELPTVAFAVGTIFSWLIIGKRRLEALGWPFNKITSEG